jgi:hypothetical protein
VAVFGPSSDDHNDPRLHRRSVQGRASSARLAIVASHAHAGCANCPHRFRALTFRRAGRDSHQARRLRCRSMFRASRPERRRCLCATSRGRS